MTTCIDLRQFSSAPYRSGIQRVIVELLRSLNEQGFDAWALVKSEGEPALIALEDAITLLDACFDFSGEHREDLNNLQALVTDFLKTIPTYFVEISQCLKIFDGWLIPEPSFQRELIDSWREIAQQVPTTAIFHDALPVMEPTHYSPSASDPTSYYFRWITTLESVVTNSQESLAALVELAGGRQEPGWVVATPSGEHASRIASALPNEWTNRDFFISVSSTEPRKRFPLTLRAFSRFREVHPEVSLLIIGRRSMHQDLEKILEQDNLQENVEWLKGANDSAVFSALSHAVGSISVGDEGFGILPLESLSLGTRVIAGGVQPSLAVIPETRFLFEVSPLDESTLAEQMGRALIDYREARVNKVRPPLKLPSWSAFALVVSEQLQTRRR